MIISRKSVLSVVLGLALFAPVAVYAQDAEITVEDGMVSDVETLFAPSTMVVKAADGTESTYVVNDFSFYTSNSPAYDDVPAATSLSININSIAPMDAALLTWSSRSAENADINRDLTVTVSQPGAEGSDELVYQIDDAYVVSLSAANSTYAEPSISLTIEAAGIVVGGVSLN